MKKVGCSVGFHKVNDRCVPNKKLLQDAKKFNNHKSWANSFPYERACREDIGCELTLAHGEAGVGIYGYPSSSAAMKKYYTTGDPLLKNVVKIKFVEKNPVDLTKELDKLIPFLKSEQDKTAKSMGEGFIKYPINRSNYQRKSYGIMEYMKKHHPDSPGYLISHSGPGIPKSKQLVVTKPENIIFVDKKEIKNIWEKSR